MDTNVNQYLKNLLTNIEPYALAQSDKKQIDRDKAQFIIDKLSRKKFRRKKLAPKTKDSIAAKVRDSIKRNIPIHFVVPFGGYKHFWNPSHPEPDWAEVFNFRYLTEYALPVLAVYEPGVLIEYMSEDMILSRMNNYPPQALEKYSQVFGELIDWYNEQTPKNLEFKYFRVSDKVNKQELINEVELLLPERKAAFEKLTMEEKEREIHRSGRSVFWKGDKDLSNLSEEEKEARIIESRLIELAYYDTEASPKFLGEYLWEDNHICICFSFGTTHDNEEFQDLTLGSTYGSIVDYWIGRGILRKQGDKFTPDIVSKTQYETLKDKLVKVNTPDILSFTNFQSIEFNPI